MSAVMKARVEAPLETLRRLEGAFTRTGGAPPTPDQVNALLAAAGSLLRRSAQAAAHREWIASLLGRLSSEAVAGWAGAVDVFGVEARLRRATEEAVEAALPESDEEAPTWASWAKEGVEARDELESCCAALRAREDLGFGTDAHHREAVAKRLQAQDRTVKGRARWLVGLNAWRREERDLLDADRRDAAWWFSLRSDCDALLPALAGGPVDAAHLRDCAACRSDLESSRAAEARRTRHLSEEDLWGYDLGTLPTAQRVWVDLHVGVCGACAQAVAALEEGEEAILELTAPFGTGGQVPTSAGPGATVIDFRERLRTNTEPEVLADNAHFRLLLFRPRGGNGARVVVQPLGPRRIAAAALHFAHEPHHTLAARPGPEGWQFDLGEAARFSGAAHVKVRLAGVAGDVACEVKVPAGGRG